MNKPKPSQECMNLVGEFITVSEHKPKLLTFEAAAVVMEYCLDTTISRRADMLKTLKTRLKEYL